MSYETILISHDPRGVATLTLNRPDKHNALNARMIADLTEAAAELAADAAIRAVILTGAGTSFCAGGDLAWMRTPAPPRSPTKQACGSRIFMRLVEDNNGVGHGPLGTR